ncbi:MULTISPECIES: LysR substrate-binding domain-containing protein [Dyella]|uniref:LysR family transcriptional regulator n=2 Tax=Dyella TaxID=231454 RepID=A0A4R0YJU6_9GAMM|nr:MULTISPECIES: LysR substrate-binding domain-containing protein [Dyella]TBR35999.1 LysR family transcriptional regulator [Dyella terrae]TCI08752.1 LysR family transcriptional regulator [Dyella soli]
MLRLSLEALQILDAIDRRGSFAGAAKELHKVPSTISYSVGQLEEQLGVQLFERSGPRVALTEPGAELLKEGRYLLRAAEDLEARVRRVASGWETELSIGMDSLFAPIALQEDIRAFLAEADQTRLRLDQGALTGTWESLLDRRTDLLIGAAGDGPSGGGYQTEAMGELSFVFVVAPEHPLAAVGHPLSKLDLQPHRVVVVADSARKLPTRTVGLQSGQHVITVPDIRSKFEFQRAGLGCGFLPEPYVRGAVAAGELIVKGVEEPKPDETFYLAWRTGEDGEGLRWWRERMRGAGTLERLLVLSC